jgi:hypothetical protein
LVLAVNSSIAQELLFDGDLYYEKPITNDTSQSRYSVDNISYKKNMVLTYDYFFQDKYGAKKKFIMEGNELKPDPPKDNPMYLTDYFSPVYDAIDKIKITVTDGLDTYCNDATPCTQTVFRYDFLFKNGNTRYDYMGLDGVSGLIDNKKNLWIHPPRDYTFKILQLNPFPLYFLDETKKKWTHDLDVGGFWLDPRWIDHKATITIKSEYIRARDETVSTPFENINCKVTNATGTADLGNKIMKTGLKSYYHPDYGFVRLEYTNVDESKIVITLIEKK